MSKDKDSSRTGLREGPLAIRYCSPLQQICDSQLLTAQTLFGKEYSYLVSHMLFYLQLRSKDRHNTEGFLGFRSCLERTTQNFTPALYKDGDAQMETRAWFESEVLQPTSHLQPVFYMQRDRLIQPLLTE